MSATMIVQYKSQSSPHTSKGAMTRPSVLGSINRQTNARSLSGKKQSFNTGTRPTKSLCSASISLPSMNIVIYRPPGSTLATMWFNGRVLGDFSSFMHSPASYCVKLNPSIEQLKVLSRDASKIRHVHYPFPDYLRRMHGFDLGNWLVTEVGKELLDIAKIIANTNKSDAVNPRSSDEKPRFTCESRTTQILA
jgi:hypothetical protein